MTSNLGAQRPLLLYPHLSPRAGHSFCLCVGFSISSFLQWDEGIPPCSTVPHLDTYTNKNTERSNKRGAPWKIWGKIARLLDAPVNRWWSTPASRILVPLLIVDVGKQQPSEFSLPSANNVSLFSCLFPFSLPWSTNVEELPILVTLLREKEEFVQQFLQEFWTSTCFFFPIWTFRFFVFLFQMLI